MIGFPLLIIPFAIYNMIAFLTPDVSWTGADLQPVPLKSGVAWTGTLERRVPRLFAADADVRVHQVGASRQVASSSISCRCCSPAVPQPNSGCCRDAGNSTFLLFVVICFVDLFAASRPRCAARGAPWWSRNPFTVDAL